MMNVKYVHVHMNTFAHSSFALLRTTGVRGTVRSKQWLDSIPR